MRAVSLPSFHLAPSWFAIIGLVAVVILGLVLLAFGGVLFASPLDQTPDGQLLGPFRWLPPGAMSVEA